MNLDLGARVTVTACRCALHGRTGVIGAVVEGQRAPYRVDGLEPWALWFTADEIQAIHEGEK